MPRESERADRAPNIVSSDYARLFHGDSLDARAFDVNSGGFVTCVDRDDASAFDRDDASAFDRVKVSAFDRDDASAFDRDDASAFDRVKVSAFDGEIKYDSPPSTKKDSLDEAMTSYSRRATILNHLEIEHRERSARRARDALRDILTRDIERVDFLTNDENQLDRLFLSWRHAQMRTQTSTDDQFDLSSLFDVTSSTIMALNVDVSRDPIADMRRRFAHRKALHKAFQCMSASDIDVAVRETKSFIENIDAQLAQPATCAGSSSSVLQSIDDALVAVRVNE